MDGTAANLSLYLVATFAAALVTSIAGFAFGLVAAVWLHILAIFAMSGLWLGVNGSISRNTIWFFIVGLPVLLVGTWAGLKLYGHLDEAGFRKVVLVLLLVSAVALVAPAVTPWFTA